MLDHRNNGIGVVEEVQVLSIKAYSIFQTKNPSVKGPIVIIDDDEDDINLIVDGLKSLHVDNEVISFNRAGEAIAYFNQTLKKPFIILCDINMPEIDGLELRQKILDSPMFRINTVPFLFLSTSEHNAVVRHAYKLSDQGYFVKPSSVAGTIEMLRVIVAYWKLSHRPVMRGY